MTLKIFQGTEKFVSRHAIIFGYYKLFVKILGNKCKVIYYYNLNKSWEELDT